MLVMHVLLAGMLALLVLAPTALAAAPVGRIAKDHGSRSSSVVPQSDTNGSITGVVRAAAGNEAISGIEVCAYPGFEEVGEVLAACATTNASGEYTVSGLAAGEYIVKFAVPNQSPLDYVSQYYDNQTSYVEAELVEVADGAATSGINASMSVGGTVSGTVTSTATKGPIEGIEVCAEPAGGGFESRCASSGANGEYEIAALPSGEYEISFSVPSKSNLDYVRQHYAKKVKVETGDTTPGIDAALLTGGQLSGQVTSAAGKTPVQGIEVCASSDSNESGYTERCVTSGADGVYSISSLPTGEYVVAFSVSAESDANYLDQFYDDKTSYQEATKVGVSVGGTTSGIDAAMEAGGEISGEVTSAASKDALADVEVCASGDVGTRCAVSGADGRYTIAGLATGEDTVEFFPEYESGLNDIAQYYDGKSSYEEATKVSVSVGNITPNIDAAMVAGGEITGDVISASTKKGLGDVEVCANSVSEDYEGETCTDTNSGGEYTLARLASGEYRVSFYSYRSGSNYLYQYYNGKASLSEAAKVAVVAGETTSGIDAALLAGGEITGVVTTSTDKEALADVEVCVLAGSYEAQRCARTNAKGEYVVGGLASGGYKVEFEAGGAGGEYQTQYYDDQPSFAAAEEVAVVAGSVTSGIDAAMVTDGEIRGTVKNAEGEPITTEDVCVQAYQIESGENEDWYSEQYAITNASGEYTIKGLQAGSYKVGFVDCDQVELGDFSSVRNDVPQYYSGTSDWSSASLVELSSGGVKTGIDAELAAGTTISGHVYASAIDSAPYSMECVYAEQSPTGSTPSWVSGPLAYDYTATSNDEGVYRIAHLLPSDAYVVQFSDCGLSKQYLTQFDGDASTPEAATPLTPTIGAPVTGIDAHLSPGGVFSGLVRAKGSPITSKDVCVSAARLYESDNPDAHPYDDYGYATSEANGAYSIAGLSPGNYYVHFEDCDYSSRNDVAQYYKGTDGSQTESPVEVTLGGEQSAIDVELAPATSISGFVYGSPTEAKPLDDVCVYAYSSNEAEYGYAREISYASTGDDGSYTLKHLEPGAGYKVEFEDCEDRGGYSVQYYDEASAISAAAVLTPTLAEPLTGIDAHLDNDVPTTEITGGPADDAATSATSASFSFTSTILDATYECKLDSGAYTSCSSPYETGVLSSAEHTFTVRATANGITDPSPASVTWLVEPSSPNSTSEGSVGGGGTVSSNPGEGPSTSDPVVVEATLPAAGTVTMTKEPATTPSENGYTIFSKQLDISATEQGVSTPLVGTVEHPITLSFEIAGTEIPVGTELTSITVLRNGVPAANCSGVPGSASPDPCIESRRATAGGGVALTVLTTHCSLWNFATTSSSKVEEEEALAKKPAEEETAVARMRAEAEAAARKKAEAEAATKKRVDEEAAAAAKIGALGAKASASVKVETVKVTASSIVLTIKTSAAGTVSIAGPGLKKTVKSLAAGTRRVTVALTKAGKAERRARKRIKLAVSLKTSSGTVAISERARL